MNQIFYFVWSMNTTYFTNTYKAHGFTNKGLLYDGLGRKLPAGILSYSSLQNYQKIEEGLKEYYDKFSIHYDGIEYKPARHFGDDTIRENIADILGVQLGYR